MTRLTPPLMLCAQLALAAEVAGVKVDERVKLGSSELQLNGAGIRTRLFFKVYVGALYLPERKSSATEVLALRGAKRVSMALLRDLTARQLTDALEEGIRANSSEAELAALKERIDRSEEHTSELQSLRHLVFRLLLEKKKK